MECEWVYYDYEWDYYEYEWEYYDGILSILMFNFV